jgi:anaerobic selenocysteine-containing dehydrogenase
VIDAMITGEPYPVKAWIIQNANPVLSFASADRVIEAIKRLEFTMVLGYTPSPTSDLADLILPIAHPFEQNGMRFSSYGNWLSAMPKVVDPPEGCREDLRVVHDIAEAMVKKGYVAKNLIPWKDYDQLMEANFAGTDMTYQELCENGPLINEIEYRRYEKNGFKTPSGKVELYSERMAKHGYEPLPVYRECEESPVLLPRLGERYPLYFTTRRSYEYALSRSADYEWVREITPFPELHIHHETAKTRGIEEGECVVIETPMGSIQHVAVLTNDIRTDVVNGVFGWWLPEKENDEKGCLVTNVNRVLSYYPPYDPEIGINSIQGVMCQVRKLS